MYVRLKSVHESYKYTRNKKPCSSSLHWDAVSKLIGHSFALTLTADVYRIWYTVILVYRNIQVATIAIDCIQLWQGIWLLAREKWADFIAPYKQRKCTGMECD